MDQLVHLLQALFLQRICASVLSWFSLLHVTPPSRHSGFKGIYVVLTMLL